MMSRSEIINGVRSGTIQAHEANTVLLMDIRDMIEQLLIRLNEQPKEQRRWV